MREIYIRGISGGLYAISILIALFNNQITFSIVIIVFSILALIEFQRLINYKSYFAITLLLLLVYNFYRSHIDYSSIVYLLIANFASHFFLFYKLVKSKKIKYKYITKSILSTLYLALGCFFIIALAGNVNQYQPQNILLFFVLIWINNSCAYLIGKKLGKNPLFLRVSPKKTWEGFVGGLIFTLITALIFHHFYANQSILYYLIIALITSVLATLGDLIQSLFKRYAKVKDSGSLIPGHGGFFDRMDSVIFVAPWFYLLLNYKEYVS